MPKPERTYTPEQNELFRIANDDIGAVYYNISDSQALNTAIYTLLDNATELEPSNPQIIINKAMALLTIQEERLKTLVEATNTVMNNLFKLINAPEKEQVCRK